MDNNKNINIYIIIVSLVFLFMGIMIIKMVLNNRSDIDEEITTTKEVDKKKVNTEIKEELDNGIIKVSLLADEYPKDMPIVYKYYIDTREELGTFNKIFNNKVSIKYMKDYIILVKVEELPIQDCYQDEFDVVMSEKIYLNNKVECNEYDDKVVFKYNVAIIPKKLINNIDISDWIKPSKAIKNKELNNYVFVHNNDNKYIIRTDEKVRTYTRDNHSSYSYTDIYYQIDLDKNIIVKYNYKYEIDGSGFQNKNHPVKANNRIYTKRINKELSDNSKIIIDNLKEDTGDGYYYMKETYDNKKIKVFDYKEIKQLVEEYDKI